MSGRSFRASRAVEMRRGRLRLPRRRRRYGRRPACGASGRCRCRRGRRGSRTPDGSRRPCRRPTKSPTGAVSARRYRGRRPRGRPRRRRRRRVRRRRGRGRQSSATRHHVLEVVGGDVRRRLSIDCWASNPSFAPPARGPREGLVDEFVRRGVVGRPSKGWLIGPVDGRSVKARSIAPQTVASHVFDRPGRPSPAWPRPTPARFAQRPRPALAAEGRVLRCTAATVRRRGRTFESTAPSAGDRRNTPDAGRHD